MTLLTKSNTKLLVMKVFGHNNDIDIDQIFYQIVKMFLIEAKSWFNKCEDCISLQRFGRRNINPTT